MMIRSVRFTRFFAMSPKATGGGRNVAPTTALKASYCAKNGFFSTLPRKDDHDDELLQKTFTDQFDESDSLEMGKKDRVITTTTTTTTDHQTNNKGSRSKRAAVPKHQNLQPDQDTKEELDESDVIELGKEEQPTKSGIGK